MPSYVLKVWTLYDSAWKNCILADIDHRADTFRVVGLSGHQNVHVIGKRDQPAIKHPMGCARQCEPVADYVRAVSLDLLDMRRLHLFAATTIDQLQASNRAPLVISLQDHPTKNAVAEHA